MGFVTNDPKKADDQRPGGLGLTMDLDLMACPSCRREVPVWLDRCERCDEAPVARTSLQSSMPDIPAHLLGDDPDDTDDADADDPAADVPDGSAQADRPADAATAQAATDPAESDASDAE